MVPKRLDFELARSAAERGAAIIRERFGQILEIEEKANQKGLVTEVDKQAEEVILGLLQSSSYGVLAEETGLSVGKSKAMWVIDPLDGTTNFVRGLPFFAVSVALVLDRKPLLGVIVNPLTGDEYCAIRGKPTLVNGKRVKIDSKKQQKTPSYFVNHGYDIEDRKRFAEVTRRLACKSYLRKLGTTALELCYVAAGHVDAFVCSGDELWDFAAGLVIAEGANCVISDWRGKPWDGSSTYVLVSHPKWHESLVDSISDLQL